MYKLNQIAFLFKPFCLLICQLISRSSERKRKRNRKRFILKFEMESESKFKKKMISKSKEVEWHSSSHLNEYEKLVLRMNTPRVVIDNASSATATLVKVDSARNHAFLLDTVQVLTDLNLLINKAYISSDGPYFMDVFHVTDHFGHKLNDESIMSYIKHSIQSPNPIEPNVSERGHVALELTGIDRPGLLSEVFAVLSDLKCIVNQAKVWTHNGCTGAIIFVEDDSSLFDVVESRLRHVVKGSVVLGNVECHMDRRLHQMMVEDRDYENLERRDDVEIEVENLIEPGYSIVNVGCRDRPKLLFDIICVLTDMEYVVFHCNVYTDGGRASQEFYIRHADGTPISSEAERQHVIQCLQAAIKRRSYEGLKLELCTVDRLGLLSEATRTFRENGLLVTGAEVSMVNDAATIIFYVTDANGNLPVTSTIDSVRKIIGENCLQVKDGNLQKSPLKELEEGDGKVKSNGVGLFYLGSLVLKNLFNLILIRSCS